MEYNAELELAMDACADRLEFLNATFPLLATAKTMDGVLRWRKCRVQDPVPEAPTDILPQQESANSDIGAVAIGLLQQHSFEDVLELLQGRHNVKLSLPQLINLIGKHKYLSFLKRDVTELLKNAISYEQIAFLWNDLERPALSGPVWSSRSISMLVG